MDIALLNVRITFQKNTGVTDPIGNHKNEWLDVHSCYATVSGEGGTEDERTGQTLETEKKDFTVRYSSETASVGQTTHRIVFGGDLYNIVNVDHMNYRKKALKFRCVKVRR